MFNYATVMACHDDDVGAWTCREAYNIEANSVVVAGLLPALKRAVKNLGQSLVSSNKGTFWNAAYAVVAVERSLEGAAYIGGLAHELAHVTALTLRPELDPTAGLTLPTQDVATEECIAQLGAAIFMARQGLVIDDAVCTGYVKHWLRHLEDDAQAVFTNTIAPKAQEAADLLCAVVEECKSALLSD